MVEISKVARCSLGNSIIRSNPSIVCSLTRRFNVEQIQLARRTNPSVTKILQIRNTAVLKVKPLITSVDTF